jgi:hypothetical protein
MSLAEFKKGLLEEYQGELIGEVVFSELARHFGSPQHQYKLGTLLQLETETAARLRPTALELGVDLFFRGEYREMGQEFLKSFDGKDWPDLMTGLGTAVEPFVKRYTEIAEIAPPEYKDLADSMVVHERAILTFTRLELSGDTERSLDDVMKQLTFPLKQPS